MLLLLLSRYSTTDLAAIRHRVTTERADRVLYVVDVGQGSHFAQVRVLCACLVSEVVWYPEMDPSPFWLFAAAAC